MLVWCDYYSKNSDKGKYVCSGYGMVFNTRGSWSFGNDFARKVLIFDVDNSSPSDTDYRKNNILVLGLGPTDDIHGSVGAAKKKIKIIFSKETI